VAALKNVDCVDLAGIFLEQLCGLAALRELFSVDSFVAVPITRLPAKH